MLNNKAKLASLLQVSVPDSYPEARDAIPWFIDQIQSDPSLVGWLHFMIVLSADRVLIGDVGFKGKPDESGMVEIGYSIIPEYRQQGFATEATKALIDYALSRPDVTVVQAHTRRDNIGSMKVLEKLGMTVVAMVVDDEEGEMFQWRLSRDS
jgi:RimJ/RimL family protein N-acetyltransferase